jgi:hypothetical protein
MLSYDIWCQYGKNFKTHLHSKFFPWMDEVVDRICGAILRMHIHGHNKKCQLNCSFMYTLYSGMTCGEGIESTWSEQNHTAAPRNRVVDIVTTHSMTLIIIGIGPSWSNSVRSLSSQCSFSGWHHNCQAGYTFCSNTRSSQMLTMNCSSLLINSSDASWLQISDLGKKWRKICQKAMITKWIWRNSIWQRK